MVKKVTNVCGIHQPKQGMPKGVFFSSQERLNGGRYRDRYELLSFLGIFSGYNQIYKAEENEPHTSFHTKVHFVLKLSPWVEK